MFNSFYWLVQSEQSIKVTRGQNQISQNQYCPKAWNIMAWNSPQMSIITLVVVSTDTGPPHQADKVGLKQIQGPLWHGQPSTWPIHFCTVMSMKYSFGQLQTLRCPLFWLRLKQTTSPKMTFAHWCRVRCIWHLWKASRATLYGWARHGHPSGRRERSWHSWERP